MRRTATLGLPTARISMTTGAEVLTGDLVGDLPIATRPLGLEISVATAGPDLMRFAVAAVTGNAHGGRCGPICGIAYLD